MVRFILVTFAFLAWLFYIMSGGADFDPDRARAEMSKTNPLKQREQADAGSQRERTEDVEVTRVSLDLTSVDDVLNGTDGTEQPQRLPQSRTATQPASLSAAPAENVEIYPSLTESASLSQDIDRVIPSLIQDASPQNAAAVAQVSAAGGADIRVVTGSRVNVRGGPGTSYGVVGKLVEGDRVEVLDDSGTGWVRMRPADGGTVGWMADFLLTDG